MFTRLTTILLLGFSLSIAPNAQQTPQIEGQERVIRVYSGESGSFLGVELKEVTKENFAKYQLKEVRGVAVEKVVENSPATQAGLQDLDVIIRFNGEEVSSLRKLSRLLSETAPDHQAKITVLRDEKELELLAIMGKRPAPKFIDSGLPGMSRFPSQSPMPSILSVPSFGRFPLPSGSGDVLVMRGEGQEILLNSNSRQIGVVTSSLTKQLADFFGVDDGKGVLINSVLEDSPASRAGLRAGDVIIETDGKPVENQLELSRTVAAKIEGEVILTVIRDKERQNIKVTPEKIEPKTFPKPKKGY